MNFLAHLYLSGTDEQIQLGNFIADSVKGKSYLNFPEKVLQGILLHRSIDNFTDNHPIVEITKKRLRGSFHKYAPVISDIYYDHFLAKYWHEFSEINLENYASDFYEVLNANKDILPERTLQMMPHLIKGNWLVSYRSVEGIHRVLSGMSRRTTFVSNMEHAAEELNANYNFYEQEFRHFFPELIAHAKAISSTLENGKK
ncbi:MAG: acyl carrier protein phosphodiesterase [Bacteroidia bacterium]|nr:acyl carrier protein phosphodiesterase [Bacteroidia bacterium]